MTFDAAELGLRRAGVFGGGLGLSYVGFRSCGTGGWGGNVIEMI